jgi:hypothetical protein
MELFELLSEQAIIPKIDQSILPGAGITFRLSKSGC